MYERDTLLRDLRSNIIEVHFEKVNGERRVMRCTLIPKYLPQLYNESQIERDSENKFHSENKEVIAAWDVKNHGWRSFRIDSVQYVQVLDADY